MACQCTSGISQETIEKTQKHPCYSEEAHHKYARMHLPVAPNCNIQCNYCNRKYDCINESRPGVTSEILTPALAKKKFLWVKEKIAELAVVGIAGPGDPLANWEATKETIEKIKAIDPEVTFCLSTNGLMLPEYAAQIVQLGVRHVTVTINNLDAEIGARIYQFISYKGIVYEGVEGAELLLKNQLAGIEYLIQRGVLVKINIVMMKGINDHHIPQIVKKVKELGVFVTNIMPLIPAPDSTFADFPQTSMKDINELRDLCQIDIKQMRHCKQCRADAIGLLHEDRSLEFRMCNRQAAVPKNEKATEKQYKIAVTSKYGKLVDQHFGHADKFIIYQGDGCDFKKIEVRSVDKFCSGVNECDTGENKRDGIIATLQDCDAVLTMRIGYHAKEKLKEKEISSIEYCDTVEQGLEYAVSQLLNEEKEKRALLRG